MLMIFDQKTARTKCHQYRQVGKPAVREKDLKIVGRGCGILLFVDRDFGDYDALADGLHHVMSLQGAAENNESGHHQRGLAIGDDPGPNGRADAIGRVIGADIPAHVESRNEQDCGEEDVHRSS